MTFFYAFQVRFSKKKILLTYCYEYSKASEADRKTLITFLNAPLISARLVIILYYNDEFSLA